MTEPNDKLPSIPRVPIVVDLAGTLIEVVPEETLDDKRQRISRRTGLSLALLGGPLVIFAAIAWSRTGGAIGMVVLGLAWAVFSQLLRRGLAKRRLRGESVEAEKVLALCPELGVRISKNTFRKWLKTVAGELPNGSVIRLFSHQPDPCLAYSAPFEPFFVYDLPDWIHDGLENDLSIDLPTSSDPSNMQMSEQWVPPPRSGSIHNLIMRCRSALARLVGMSVLTGTLLMFIAVVLYVGYVVWLSFVAILEYIVYRKPPEFPGLFYAVGIAGCWLLPQEYIKRLKQIWIVPGGIIRRNTRPWWRHWENELLVRNDSILVLDETLSQTLGTHVINRGQIFEIDLGALPPDRFLSAWLSPVSPPELGKLTELN